MTSTSSARIVLALGSTQTLAWGSSYYLSAILATPMAHDLGRSTEWIFAAMSAALIVSAVLGPWVGRRIDRRGGRDVLALSNLVFAIGLSLLGLTEGLLSLCVAWLVIGIGMAMGLYEAAFSTLAGIYGRDARGAITGITLLAGFASTICWPISAFLEAEVGWRMTCFLWAAAHLLLGLPLNRLLLPVDTQPEVEPTAMAGVPAATGRALWLLAFVFAVTWFISTAMAAHLPRLLQEVGATTKLAVAVAALVGPAQVVARLLEYGMLRRRHPLLSARLAALAHPIGAAALLLFGAPAAVFFALVHGAGNGVLTIAKGTLPLVLFGANGYGFRQGVLTVPARFAQAVAPFLFAVLIERFGARALLLSIGLGLAGMAALLVLGPLSKKPDET